MGTWTDQSTSAWEPPQRSCAYTTQAVAGVKATAKVTLSTVLATHTLVVNGTTLTAHGSTNTGAYFSIGGTDAEDATNLAAAINRYTSTHHCTAAATDDYVIISADVDGTHGNAYTLAETGSTMTLSGSVFGTGTGATAGVSGTFTDAAPTSATDGVGLGQAKSLIVHLETDSARALLVGTGDLLAYIYNKFSGAWNPCPALNLAVDATGTGQSWDGVEIVGGPTGRITWIPSGVQAGGDTLTVYVLAG